MKKSLSAITISLFIFFLLFIYQSQKSIESVPPTSVKDILSSSQLSFFGRLDVGNTVANSIIKLIVGSTSPSKSTTNLFVGDTIGIGTTGAGIGLTGPLTIYTIRDIGNTATIQINTGIGQSNTFPGAAVVATRSATHTLYFTPKNSITGGAWQFLIKASSRTGENHQDGIPDQQGFDLGQDVGATSTGLGTRLKVADVNCPFGASASVGTTAVISSNSYHIVTCTLGAGATNPIDVGATMIIGRALASGSQLINPSASLSHTEGSASSSGPDIYTFFVRHLDAGSAVIDVDTATGKIAVIESVRVTATVDPTLTFSIDSTNVGSGATICGNGLGTNAANTTATSVAFGSLTLGAFNDLGQRLSAVTNAVGGYVVTVYEDKAMTNISSGTTIADTNCDGGCSATSYANWNTDNTHSEWGYSIETISGTTTPFVYTTGVGATFAAKAFGLGAANARTIMSTSVVPQATERIYMCYRLTASTTQEAGNYESKLVYTATATF